VVYVYPRYAPMADGYSAFGNSEMRTLADRYSASYEVVPRHASGETCCRERDGVVARPCGFETWEYWTANGATAALSICADVRHVEEIYMFGGFY